MEQEGTPGDPTVGKWSPDADGMILDGLDGLDGHPTSHALDAIVSGRRERQRRTSIDPLLCSSSESSTVHASYTAQLVGLAVPAAVPCTAACSSLRDEKVSDACGNWAVLTLRLAQ
ncbi:hypothetical protein V499_04175 [Pseudogymnoascus sp. VKM F-103]|nr:hypothetical protein V499_04175 [Pseudogymnoascus sp. VKM F-103]